LSDYERKIGALQAIIQIGPEAHAAAPAVIDILRHAQHSSPSGPQSASTNGLGTGLEFGRLMNLNGAAVLVEGNPTNPAIIASISGAVIRPATLPEFPIPNLGLVNDAQTMELAAIRALTVVHVGNRNTFEALLDSLRDHEVANAAIVAIRQILKADRSSVGALLAAVYGWRYNPLPDELPPLGRGAELLGIMISDDAGIQASLVELTSNADPIVRAIAAKALRNGSLANPQVFLALCIAAADSHENVRTAATAVMIESEQRYREFWKLLLGASEDSRSSVRLGVAEILGQLGEPARRALPYTKGMLHDTDPAVRARAAMAIGKLGAWGRDAIPELKLAASDPDPAVKKAALDALAAVE
jgi:hypothetical protein